MATHDQIEDIPPIEIEFYQGLRAATGELIMKDASDFVRLMDASLSLRLSGAVADSSYSPQIYWGLVHLVRFLSPARATTSSSLDKGLPRIRVSANCG